MWSILVDQHKIILMTKLAIYEKKYFHEDKRRDSYYLEDYIFMNNFKVRFNITIMIILLAGLDILKKMGDYFIFPESVMSFFKLYVSPYLIPWIIMIVLYTLISTIIYARRYALSQQRLAYYNRLLKQLDSYEQDQASKERSNYENK